MKYFADWEDSKKEGLLRDFNIDKAHLSGCKILFAAYTYEDYSGDAFVLFVKDGVLYEVNGSHCSCFGLEGQWEPEETTAEAIRKRGKNWGVFYVFEKEIKKVLEKIK